VYYLGRDARKHTLFVFETLTGWDVIFQKLVLKKIHSINYS